MWMFLWCLVMGVSEAGKLAEGFRGAPFGPDSAIAESPMPGCVWDPEAEVRWRCNTTIGAAEVQVNYMVKEGLFYGIYVESQGYTNADALLTVLLEAYGHGRKEHDWDDSKLANRSWFDGSVIGYFKYNQFSGKAVFVAFDLNVKEHIDSLKAERARAGVNDL